MVNISDLISCICIYTLMYRQNFCYQHYINLQYKTKYNSLFCLGLLLSRNAEKDYTDQSILLVSLLYLKRKHSQTLSLRNDALFVLAWAAWVEYLRGWSASVGGVGGVLVWQRASVGDVGWVLARVAWVACQCGWRGWRANSSCMLLLLLLLLLLKQYPEEKNNFIKKLTFTKMKKCSKQ